MVKFSADDIAKCNIEYFHDKVYAILYEMLKWCHEHKKCSRPEEIWYETQQFVCTLNDVLYPEVQIDGMIEHLRAGGASENDIFLILFCVCYKLTPSAKKGDKWSFKVFSLLYQKVCRHNWFEHLELMVNYNEKKLVKTGYKPLNLTIYNREHRMFDNKELKENLQSDKPTDVEEDIDVPKERIMELPSIVLPWIREDDYNSNLLVVIIRKKILQMLGSARGKAKWAHVLKVMNDLPIISTVDYDKPKPFGDFLSGIVGKSSETIVKGVTNHRDKINATSRAGTEAPSIDDSICQEIKKAFGSLMKRQPQL